MSGSALHCRFPSEPGRKLKRRNSLLSVALAGVLAVSLVPSFALANEGAGATQAVDGSEVVVGADTQKAAELTANLANRFSVDGLDADDTLYVPLALNALGQGTFIDSKALLDSLAADTNAGAGRLGKYVMALTAAGADCTNVTVGGEKRNLLEEMTEAVADDISVFDAVWVLPAYACSDTYSSYGERVEQTLLAAITGAQAEGGLIGYPGWEDVQTTSQAVMALLPYRDDVAVSAVVDNAVSAVLASQNDDGGFPNMIGGASNVDTTGSVVAMLAALGYDTAADDKFATENGQTPIGFLVSRADDDLSGFTTYTAAQDYGNELMTSATALLGLAAAQEACNVYLPQTVDNAPVVAVSRFADVTGSEWYVRNGAASFAASSGIITGVSLKDGTHAFNGGVAMTRAEFVTVLHRLAGAPSADAATTFSDVKAGSWYAESVAWAQKYGIVQGYSGSGKFGPDDTVTREQAAVMLSRYAHQGSMTGDGALQSADLASFVDANEVTFGKDEMQWAVNEGIVGGTKGALEPKRAATRGEACTMVMRFAGQTTASRDM